MASMRIECLRCGDARVLKRRPRHHLDDGECPRCGYVGWAASAEVTEATRRTLRERPLETRRVRLVA